ncbi:MULTISPECIES: YigZ family protein [unclassified Corynebacterium]|uniref:YigZ family protein n=1 Tax=unclassified Corynebacterium TaxID=2624378 RepID=UPI002A91F9AC|nr:YigZ family protein [Corynebacterium sp.]MDY5786542.1 YigZ family protein [Corynebacterium sp.]
MSGPTTADSYECPRAGDTVTAELEIKRSRFITWVERAQSEEEARDLIARAREAYPDARHHCSAYIYRVDGAQPVARSSDDGEPSGTAGRPMLEVLNGSGMSDIAVVVIRYFGGVKLGTGGLVSAYTAAVSEALAKVERVTRRKMQRARVDLPHAEAGRIEAELRTAGVEIAEVEYATMARYTVAFDPEELSRVEELLASATKGSAELRAPDGEQHTWVEVATVK